MIKTIITIVLLLIFSVQSGFCDTLTLNEAITLGIQNNAQLQSERAKLGISEAKIKTAGLKINPRITLDAALAENAYKAGIEETIELGGKRKKRINVAKSEKEIMMQELSTNIIDLRANIRNSYIKTYAAQEKLKTANEILQMTEKLANIANKRKIAGDIAQLDVLQAEIVAIKAKNEIQTANLEATQGFNELCNYTGEDLLRETELKKPEIVEISNTSNNPENEIKLLLDEAYANRPELKRLQKNIEKTIALKKLAQSSAIPNLTFSLGPNIAVTDEDNRKTTKVNIFAGLSMDIPVFDHGQGMAQEAKAQQNQLEKQLLAEKKQIELEIKNSYVGISRNAESVRIYEQELLPKAKEILTKSKLSFQEGKSSILMSLTSQEAYINAQIGYINALTNYQKSLSDFERAIGANNENL